MRLFLGNSTIVWLVDPQGTTSNKPPDRPIIAQLLFEESKAMARMRPTTAYLALPGYRTGEVASKDLLRLLLSTDVHVATSRPHAATALWYKRRLHLVIGLRC
jgi:hypothetical protein